MHVQQKEASSISSSGTGKEGTARLGHHRQKVRTSRGRGFERSGKSKKGWEGRKEPGKSRDKILQEKKT